MQTLLNVEDGADVTVATNVDAAGAVMEGDYAAYSVLAADTVDVPAPVTMAASTMLARLAAGGIVAASVSDIQTLLGIPIVVDDHVRSYHANLPAQTDEAEVSALLSGDAAKRFAPTEMAVKLVSFTGVIAGDFSINIGTTPDGSDIWGALAPIGLNAPGDTVIVATFFGARNIPGNSRIYVNIEAKDSTAVTLILDVWLLGRQL
jgi:hypothetical protein